VNHEHDATPPVSNQAAVTRPSSGAAAEPAVASPTAPAIAEWLTGNAALHHPTAAALRQSTALQLQRSHGNRFAASLMTPASGSKISRLVDQHLGAQIPTAPQQSTIHNLLHPNAAAGPGAAPGARSPWDGASVGGVVSPAATANRTALRNAMFAALTARLNMVMPLVNAAAARRRLPMTSLEGAGRGAKRVVDAVFGSLSTAAAWTPGQATQHATFQFQGAGPGQNLFDAYDPVQRATAGHPVNPEDLTNWMTETDAGARAAAAAHHFDPYGSNEERTFLYNVVVAPFAAARQADLVLYDLFGFAISGDRIVVGSSVAPGLPDAPGAGGAPSLAERAKKWGTWRTLVHEYIHTLEHPASRIASQGNRIIKEGFCEMFTREVLVPLLPVAGNDAALRTEIEGADYGPPPPGIIPNYNPGDYAGYLQQAEAIRDNAIGGAGRANAVKAAYFQGHVEFLGLTPAGALAPPAAPGSADLITVPAGIPTLAALAVATGVPEAVIRQANPALGPGPLPAQLRIPGCRYHVVVEATPWHRGLGWRRDARVETRQQIATQNGVTPAALDLANPGLNWGGLHAGDRVLIPAHWASGI
jgi:hypothetical protein